MQITPEFHDILIDTLHDMFSLCFGTRTKTFCRLQHFYFLPCKNVVLHWQTSPRNSEGLTPCLILSSNLFSEFKSNDALKRHLFDNTLNLKMKKRAQLDKSVNEKYLGSCNEEIIWTEYSTMGNKLIR